MSYDKRQSHVDSWWILKWTFVLCVGFAFGVGLFTLIAELMN